MSRGANADQYIPDIRVSRLQQWPCSAGCEERLSPKKVRWLETSNVLDCPPILVEYQLR